MNKIWLDVTSILGWPRPAVGIIRVEAECAKFALGHLESKLEFCRFDPQKGYVRVDASEVRQTLDRIGRFRQPDEQILASNPIPSIAPGVSSTARLATLVRSILQRLPTSMRGPVYRYLAERREAAHAAVNGLRELRRAVRAWRKPLARMTQVASSPVAKELGLPFSSGDVYVSLGLDWDQKNQAYIAEKKYSENFKALLCCYDVIPVKYPHLCVGDVSAKFARYFADIAWCADEIVCISECSRRDLLELLGELGAPTPPTTVIRLGSDLPKTAPQDVTSHTKDAAGGRFILFVSTIERRKNHETLYRAYTRLLDQGEKDLPKLVFVGMPGWGVADFLADLQFDGRVAGLIQVLTNVSDNDLMWLYSNALFTAFPSVYEGWGLAVAESLANGKFCLASKAASIPEVGGDLIEYLDPWDVPKWAERLKWYFDHPEEIERAEERIRTQYVAPTWENTAKTVFERAETLLGQQRREMHDGIEVGTLIALEDKERWNQKEYDAQT
ncbi:glycosyltransferase family 1 protein [Mesorhizobium sp.]|uniref:glycosyltransferase family 4 protein n=1 Tax=Mesorhizobium sp. TaxID=1871066 RepID=UPI000FE988A9|nr:glycosyltransferase family 1 protein [Mesorhizobium sp.]RWM40209.1 MAG: glycosyltransferase family 1 protein [Mesorhizobium sp.]